MPTEVNPGEDLRREVKYARALTAAWKDGHRSLMNFLGIDDDRSPGAYTYAFGCAMAALSVLCDALDQTLEGQSGKH